MNQIVGSNNISLPSKELMVANEIPDDSLTRWAAAYFGQAVTTGRRSQIELGRDIDLFLAFMIREVGHDQRPAWTPRLSRAFLDHLRSTVHGVGAKVGQRRWGDRIINRILAHLKTWAKWIDKFQPFPLGPPLAQIKGLAVSLPLLIDRALTKSERLRLLDAADLLLTVGGLSRDRRRQSTGGEVKKRAGYRPYRNRAIIYCLVETGMRRGAVTRLQVDGVDCKRRILTVVEKGGLQHPYQISRKGLQALNDYLERERNQDIDPDLASPAFFLPAINNGQSRERLHERSINYLWTEVCRQAEIIGRTPHAARHAMGRHIMAATGNVAAVQLQLGHQNAAYSLQYARITDEELQVVLDER